MPQLKEREPSSYAAAVQVERINVWHAGTRRFRVLEPMTVEPWLSPEDEEVLAEAAGDESPVWVELRLSDSWPDWYSSWREFDRPQISWDAVAPCFDRLGLHSPSPEGSSKSDLVTEVLRVLPFIYELGAARAFGEIRTPEKEKRQVRSFPAVGFEVPPDERAGDEFAFFPVRLNIASASRFVFTLGQRRPDDQEEPLRVKVESSLSGPPPLQVPLRYLPVTRQVEANDVVDGIALYLGAACEWLVEAVEVELANVELSFFGEIGDEKAEEPAPAERAEMQKKTFRRLQELGGVMRRLRRELALMIQRAPGGVPGRGDREATARVADRYEAALTKVDALQVQLASALATQQLVIAEKQRAEGERLQQLGTALASVVLVPSLIAAVYGANVPVPGGHQTQGVMAMVMFMLGGGLLTYAAITLMRERARGGLAVWYQSRALRGAFGSAAVALLVGSLLVVTLLSEETTRRPAESFSWPDVLALAGLVALVGFVAVLAGREHFPSLRRRQDRPSEPRYTRRHMKGTHITRRS